MASVSVIIPTYKAAPYLHRQIQALLQQQVAEDIEILIMDSSSPDQTVEMARSFGVRTLVVEKAKFDHGGTRTFAGRYTTGTVVVYLTQDALPVDHHAIANLIRPFSEDHRIGLVFGRQLPHADATVFAEHLRHFNYPAHSYVRTIADKDAWGIKTVFCSNSFAAYRRTALDEVGWFKSGLLMGEDSHACAKMLLKGYKVAYVADAAVYHSHNYGVVQEFKRYFDMGVFLHKERWILDTFGRVEGEGLRFMRSEIGYLIHKGLLRYIPASLGRAAAKWFGYRLGQLHGVLPRAVRRRLSMHCR